MRAFYLLSITVISITFIEYKLPYLGMKESDQKQEWIITEYDSFGKPIKTDTVDNYQVFIRAEQCYYQGRTT